MSTEFVVPTYILQSQDLFREGLRLILSETRFRPRGCAIDLGHLSGIPSDRPVLFIVGDGADQADIYSKIRSQYPLAIIVAIADESKSGSLTSALADGANAVLLSSVTPKHLISTLQAVVNGHLILIDARLWPINMRPSDEERLRPLPANDDSLDVPDQPRGLNLSVRESAILKRIVQGDSNKEVARFLGIAEPSVKAHVKAIFRKIGATNRTQAAMWAVNQRLLDQAYSVPGDLPVLPLPRHRPLKHSQ